MRTQFCLWVISLYYSCNFHIFIFFLSCNSFLFFIIVASQYFFLSSGFFIDINIFKASKEKASEIAKTVKDMKNVVESNDTSDRDGLADEDANLMIKLKFLTYKVSIDCTSYCHLHDSWNAFFLSTKFSCVFGFSS